MWGKFLSGRKKRGNTNLYYDENVMIAGGVSANCAGTPLFPSDFWDFFEIPQGAINSASATDLKCRSVRFSPCDDAAKSYGVGFGLCGGTVCGERSALGWRIAVGLGV